ncbi:hypothetical protein IE53DRAFT_63590 [Violaceomyces palustris]|uniref:Uncharacterized protein n=1 Tax=Violaceomyces palustris TaxID=1673888 RepID=A0ACD0NZ59_9BASI|nr:hypothetical protein IE53DRAFT_63590 [Violaceomyces palustris]
MLLPSLGSLSLGTRSCRGDPGAYFVSFVHFFFTASSHLVSISSFECFLDLTTLSCPLPPTRLARAQTPLPRRSYYNLIRACGALLGPREGAGDGWMDGSGRRRKLVRFGTILPSTSPYCAFARKPKAGEGGGEGGRRKALVGQLLSSFGLTLPFRRRNVCESVRGLLPFPTKPRTIHLAHSGSLHDSGWTLVGERSRWV